MKPLDCDILRIALPAIITNITLPLLGLVDTAIAGHLGATVYIGVMAVGSMMFNLVYWNFGFLRMGTSGLTAQAYGMKSTRSAHLILHRALLLAVAIGFAILLMQWLIRSILLLIIAPSAAVTQLAIHYFNIVVWGAPAVLVMMAVKGWFLGMQDSRTPMVISIAVNVINIIASTTAVYILNLGFTGIALGTLIAEYSGLVMCVAFLLKSPSQPLQGFNLKETVQASQLRRFMSINGTIFLRSMCLMIVTLAFVSIGARSGDIVLAVNSLIMQLFVLFSYFMDGIAFAGEALVGKYHGAADYRNERRCVSRLVFWGAVATIAYTLVYGTLTGEIFSLLTDRSEVIATALRYRLWCVAIPPAAMGAMVFDGVFIGITDTASMLRSVAVSAILFFAIWFAPIVAASLLSVPDVDLWLSTRIGAFATPLVENNRLWLAFIAYLAVRSAILVGRYHTISRIRL